MDHDNHRYHFSQKSITPADVYLGQNQAILQQREMVKRRTPEMRRLHDSARAPEKYNRAKEPIYLLVEVASIIYKLDDEH